MQCARLFEIVRKVAISSIQTRSLYLSTSRLGRDDRKVWINSLPKVDEGTQGDKAVDIDTTRIRASSFPDENTAHMLVDGVPYSELPVCYIKCSLNNTHMCLTDHKGNVLMYKTAGTEGYKNSRKGTTVGAQAAATALSNRMLSFSIKHCRVIVKGLGPGRLASVKGLQMCGINVVSITDNTYAPTQYYLRPRKARRL